MNKTALDYVLEGLERDGYDGLFRTDSKGNRICQCFNGNNDIRLFSDCAVLDVHRIDCQGGYKVLCSDDNCEFTTLIGSDHFHIIAEKPEHECDKCNGKGGRVEEFGKPPYNHCTFIPCTCPAGQKLRKGENIDACPKCNSDRRKSRTDAIIFYCESYYGPKTGEFYPSDKCKRNILEAKLKEGE